MKDFLRPFREKKRAKGAATLWLAVAAGGWAADAPAASPHASELGQATSDVVNPRVPVKLRRVTLDAAEICTAGLPEEMLELYRVTGEMPYLDFAADVPYGSRYEIHLVSLRAWNRNFSEKPCHVYVMLARCYAQTELYRLTGENPLLDMSRFMRNELFKIHQFEEDLRHPRADRHDCPGNRVPERRRHKTDPLDPGPKTGRVCPVLL